MSTAVHGKTSLADMLIHDAASGKNADAEREHDKTNIADFGATLMNLFDQSAAQKPAIANAASDSSGAGKSVAAAADSSSSIARKQAAIGTMAFFSGDSSGDFRIARDESNFGVGSESSNRDKSAAANTRDFAEVLADADATNVDSLGQSLDAPSKNSNKSPAADGTPSLDAGFNDFAGSPSNPQTNPPADADTYVPTSDIALDFTKGSFSSPVTSDARNAANVTQSANAAFAKLAQTAQWDAKADSHGDLPLRPSESAHSHSEPGAHGTSPALSSRDTNVDAMNANEAKHLQQQNAANPASVAGAAQADSQSLLDIQGQSLLPEQKRSTSLDGKDTVGQPTDVSAVPNSASSGADPHAVVRTSEAMPIRLTTDVPAPRDSSHSVNLRIQLSGGQTAQANLRERAGAIDVKIVTPSSASAQRVSSEIEGLRHNLDIAGIKLGHSEVSYRQGDGNRQGRDQYQPASQNQTANGKEHFIVNEVAQ